MKWSNANCMGYALGINKWLYLPYFRERDIIEIVDALEARYNIRRTKRSDMVLGKEYIVLRLGNGDFHFARRSADGHWRHKPGCWYVRSISEQEVFSKCMSGRYSSTPIVFEIL